MEIEFTYIAKEHLDEWKKSGNKTVMKKIEKLINNIKRDPFKNHNYLFFERTL